ncbi:MAG: lipocalin family protein [Weeksellaceae bacterium]|nr:lipocalin family protein [Weeksellaceae bacterium]
MNRKKLIIPISLGVLGFLVFNSCTPKIPKGAVAVSNFESEKYLGKWYEIARFDFRFEKDLKNVTADYSKKANGAITVLNRGFNYKKNKWVQAEGEAKPVGDKDVAKLKVSFFKPFWSGYNVIDIEDYAYALVAGDSLDYLWILSREKTIPDEIKERFLSKARSIGYNTANLVWVTHD